MALPFAVAMAYSAAFAKRVLGQVFLKITWDDLWSEAQHL